MGSEKVTFSNIEPKARKMAMIGIGLAMLIACLDNTIMGTCGNEIVGYFGKYDMYSWIFTSYLLCETAMIPIAGKMSDHFGRKRLFIVGLLLFTVGSILSGLSREWTFESLIIFRAVQGFGAGIIVPVATASVADFYPPESRGKMQGMLGAVFGIGSGIGPLVGGFICSITTWNWLFFINVPLAIICLILTSRRFPEMAESSLKRIDYIGIALISILIVDILLFFQWVGDEFEVISWQTAGMILFAVLMVFVVVWRERRAEDPIIAPSLMHNKTVVKSSIFLFIVGVAMIGTLTYIAMYIIRVYFPGDDNSTMECGYVLLSMVLGMMLTSMASGMMVAKTGYRIWIVAGAVITTAALFLMSSLNEKSDIVFLIVYLFIFGFGLGCLNSTVMVAVQNTSKPGEIGMTTSTVSLFRSIGSTVGSALYGLIVGAKMDSEFANTAYAGLADYFNLHGTGLITLIDIMGSTIPGLTDTIVKIFSQGMSLALLVAGCMFIIAIILGLTMSSKYEVKEE